MFRQWTECGADRPQSQFELFNLRHSILRSSAAECGFGLFKGKWRRFKTQTICKRTIMSKMLVAASYLHNFCVDAEYAWSHCEDGVFATASIAALRAEFVEALRDASGATVEDTALAQNAGAAGNGIEDADANGDPPPETNSLLIRDEIAVYGWGRYQVALQDGRSFASNEASRTSVMEPLQQAAHAIATTAPVSSYHT